MTKLNMSEIRKYAEEQIAIFHKQRLQVVTESLNLDKLLLHKNPYLFRAKNIFTAQQLIKSMADAYLVSGEETKFGVILLKALLFLSVIKFMVLKNWKKRAREWTSNLKKTE